MKGLKATSLKDSASRTDESGRSMGQSQTPLKKFVRVTGVRSGRYVEFEFSVNDADLTVELILPLAAFEEFCTLQDVTRLAPDGEVAGELEKLAWRTRQPGLLRSVSRAGDRECEPNSPHDVRA
jgi:phenol/toluene 2-monooxygenase (NADH) P0/A0